LIINLINNQPIKDIIGVFSCLDSRIKTAAELAAKLNTLGNDKACINLCSKSQVQKFIPEYSPPTVVFRRNEIPINLIKEFIRKYQKLIFKPTSSAGAMGVFTISEETICDQLNSRINSQFVQADEWITQPFIDGILFSLEGFVVNQRLSSIGFSKRFKYGDTESINIFPFCLNKTVEEMAISIVRELIERADYKYGYFHSEFILHENNPYLIDGKRSSNYNLFLVHTS
jgi:predicted ATP-grasp superfamily ATP-dependent carboligase